MRTNHRYNNFSPPYMERGGQEILRSSHTPLPPLPLSSPSRATLARAPRVARRNFIGHLLHVQYWLYESGSGWKPSNFPGFRFHDAMQIKQASAVLAQTRLCPCKLHFFFPALLSLFFLFASLFSKLIALKRILIIRLSPSLVDSFEDYLLSWLERLFFLTFIILTMMNLLYFFFEIFEMKIKQVDNVK